MNRSKIDIIHYPIKQSKQYIITENGFRSLVEVATNMHKLLVVAVTLAVAQAATVNRDCVASQTVASGTHAPSEICSGDIIFQDEFDSLDFKRWQHEQTLGGGGVSNL